MAIKCFLSWHNHNIKLGLGLLSLLKSFYLVIMYNSDIELESVLYCLDHRKLQVVDIKSGQGSHRLERYLNLGGILEKSLKIDNALKSTGKSLGRL